MAIANKRKGRVPKHYTLKLDDGQELNVSAVAGGKTVGDERQVEQVRTEFNVIITRIEHLKQQAVTATSDQEYQKALANLRRFQAKFADLESEVERMLLLVLTDWDMCLTEEDEAAGLFVPLTDEGIQTVDRDLKFDVFSKLMEKFRDGDEEKKEQSESGHDGIAVRANSANAQHSQLTTS